MEADKQEFEEAFQAAMSDEVIEDVKQVEEPPPPEAPVEEEPVAPKEPERVEVIEGFTKEELKEHLALIPKLQKALDTTNGTYGAKLAELNKAIEALKAAPTDASAPAGITLDALKQEYPDIAELLAKDLTGRVDVESVVEAKLAKERDEREAEAIAASRKRLARTHPDFRKIAFYQVEDGIVRFPDPKFGNWLANQPSDKYEAVLASKDPDELSDILTEYKKSLVAPVVENKTAVLEAAILPKGTMQQGRAMTEKEIEEAAFRAAMAD